LRRQCLQTPPNQRQVWSSTPESHILSGTH
jgi:hypothetical protein